MYTLPSEILQKIFQYLPTMDIFNLPQRLVSRGLTRKQAADHYEAEIWIERECLEAFVRLSKNSLVARNIYFVRLSLERLHKVGKEDYTEAALEGFETERMNLIHKSTPKYLKPAPKNVTPSRNIDALNNWSFKAFDGLYKNRKTENTSIVQHYKLFRAALRDQKRIKEDGEAIVLLEKAIRNLPKLSRIYIDVDQQGNHVGDHRCAKYFPSHPQKRFCSGSRRSLLVMMSACVAADRHDLYIKLAKGDYIQQDTWRWLVQHHRERWNWGRQKLVEHYGGIWSDSDLDHEESANTTKLDDSDGSDGEDWLK